MDDGELVLPLTATRALVLTEAQMALLPPREVSGLVRLLDQRREQHGCAHLKRVHKGLASDDRIAVLLCLGQAESLAPEVHAILAGCGAPPQSVQVPEHAPLTRRQFDEWNRVWPVHFHEAAATRSLAVWSDAPAEHELPVMRSHMRRAIAAAQHNAENGGRSVAAVIVRHDSSPGDSSSGGAETVAVCADATRPSPSGGECSAGGHPLSHAVMRCIEEVAREERARGYAMRKRRASSGAGAATSPADGEAQASSEASEATSAAAAIDEQPAEAASGSHLCVACEIYVTHEPCAMCAMALVHSRVRRLIYALPAAGGGALGSRYLLHTEPSLNHHFTVIRGMLVEEAKAAGLADCGDGELEGGG